MSNHNRNRSFGGSSLVSPAQILSNAEVARDVADGGTFYDQSSLTSYYQSLIDANQLTKIAHIEDARWGSKIDGSNNTSVWYDLSTVDMAQGTLANQPTWTLNSGDPYLAFNGTTNYLVAESNRWVGGDLGTFDASKGWNLKVRIRRGATGVAHILCGKSTGSTKGISISISTTDLLTIRMINTTTTNELQVMSTTTITTGSDYVIDITYAPTFSGGFYQASGVSVTINGVAETMVSVVNTLSSTDINVVQPWCIGIRDSGTPANIFNGRIYYHYFKYNI